MISTMIQKPTSAMLWLLVVVTTLLSSSVVVVNANTDNGTDIFDGSAPQDVVNVTSNATHNVLVCFLTRNSWAPASLYSAQIYQIEKFNTYLEESYSNNNGAATTPMHFDWKVLYNTDNRGVAPMLRTLVANATECDAFFGPLFSTLAVGTGPLLTAPQIDFASTSPELSDKSRFPFYNRVNDGQDATTRLLARIISQHFEWEVVNVLCTEETLGRGIAETLSESFANSGTRIGVQRCVSSNPTAEDVRGALEAVAEESRIIVLALNHILPAWTQNTTGILDQIKEMGLHETHVLIVPPDDGCLEAPGLKHALCLQGFSDDEAFGPIFQEYFNNKDTEVHRQAFLEAGVDEEIVERLLTAPYNGTFANYAQDAITYLMNAYLDYYEEEPDLFNPQDHALMNEVLRNYSFDGVTGVIRLDENGDRATEALYNLFSLSDVPGEHTIVINNKNDQINELEEIVWFDGTTNLPVASIEEDDDSDETLQRQLIYGFCAVILVIVLFFAVVLYRISKRTRNLACAPKIPSIALAFTDIESSTQLWRRDALAMSQSLEVHNKIIRQNIHKHGGYEVKTVGDAFMIGTKTAEQMIRIAVDTQRDFRDYPSWPAPDKIKIKIRFGIHVGAPEVVYDEVTKGYDYFGNDVNKAARVESACHGQQIMITADSVTDEQVEKLQKELDVTWEDGKEFELKGIDQPVQLRQITYDPELSKWHDDDDDTSDVPPSEVSGDSGDGGGEGGGRAGMGLRRRSVRLGHPTFLDVKGDDFYSEVNPFEDLTMLLLEGFFSTAISPEDTNKRFDWLFKSLLVGGNAAQSDDASRLRLLAQRLQGMVDVRGVKRAAERVAETLGNSAKEDHIGNLAELTSNASKRNLVSSMRSMKHLSSLKDASQGSFEASTGAPASPKKKDHKSLGHIRFQDEKESPTAEAAMAHLTALQQDSSMGRIPESQGPTENGSTE